jgi:hypothetical protein
MYWIIDPEARTAESWTPRSAEPQRGERALVWAPADATAPLTISVEELVSPPTPRRP